MTTDEGSVNSFDDEDQGHRQKKAYKWYKQIAKPSRATMYSLVDYFGDSIDITRQDVDLLPWNFDETQVIKEAMKAPKKTEKKDKKTEKKDKKKCKKDKERDGREDTAFAKSNRPTFLKGQIGDDLTSLDSGGLDTTDTSSSIWDQEHAQDYRVDAELLRTKITDEHNRKREERRLKREETKKSMPEVEVEDEITAEDLARKIEKDRRDERLERAFLWYTRMGSPSRQEFELRLLTQELMDITPEDVDLFPWNETGTRVMNIATMNAMITRTRLLRQSEPQVPAPQSR
jgi:hypothetical protein